MAYPEIAPTGAMASGDYVAYMMVYNQQAADYILDELSDYATASTMTEWDAMWVRILGDTGKKVAALESTVSKLKSQVFMIKDAISKL